MELHRKLYLDIDTLFLDIDECQNGANVCGPLQTCINLPGSYRCKCPKGFQSDRRECIGKKIFISKNYGW